MRSGGLEVSQETVLGGLHRPCRSRAWREDRRVEDVSRGSHEEGGEECDGECDFHVVRIERIW